MAGFVADIDKLECNSDNTSVRIGVVDGALTITIETWFEVEVQKGSDAETIQTFLNDNAAWSCGAFMPLEFAGDDGTNVWLTALRGEQVDPSSFD